MLKTFVAAVVRFVALPRSPLDHDEHVQIRYLILTKELSHGLSSTTPRQPLAARLLPIAMGLIGVAVFKMSSCTTGPFGRNQLRLSMRSKKTNSARSVSAGRRRNQAKRTLVHQNDRLVVKVREITVK